MRSTAIKAILKTSGINTRWMRIYLLIYFPIVAVISGISLTSNALFPAALWVGIWQGPTTALALSGITLLAQVVCVLAYMHIRELSAAGYRWNIAFLCIDLLRMLALYALKYWPEMVWNEYRIWPLGISF